MDWANRLGRVVLISAALCWGWTSATMLQITSPCHGFLAGNPRRMVVAPDVIRPLTYGLISGLSWGAYPRHGFGVPTACLAVDAGVGLSMQAFQVVRPQAFFAWRAARAAGFGLSCWVVLWALGWVWLAARLGLSRGLKLTRSDPLPDSHPPGSRPGPD
jgi:hypothetical protein